AKGRGRPGQGTGGADYPEIWRRSTGRLRQAPLPHGLRSRGGGGEAWRAAAAGAEGADGMEAKSLASGGLTMPKRRQLRAFDLRQIEGLAELIGVDEAGRGALAGPVVAGAVLVTKEFLEGRWAVTRGGRVNDSKQLTPEQRAEIFADIEQLVLEGQVHATFGEASVEEIETLNILGATKLAMRRALECIHPPSAFA